MTIYELEVILPPERAGDVVEIDRPMSEAPSFGEEIELAGGIVAKRVVSASFHRSPEWDCRHAAHSLQKWHPGAPHYDEKGRPAFTSKREIREFKARFGYAYD